MNLNTAAALLSSSVIIQNVSSRSLSRSDIRTSQLNTRTFDGTIRRKLFQRRRMQQKEMNPTVELRNHRKRECAPKKAQYSMLEPSTHDVGILDCNPDEYCQDDELSSLGGLCLSVTDSHSRGLQEYYTDTFIGIGACNEGIESYYECDCSKFDTEAETESFSCVIYENYCFLDDICGDFVVDSEVKEAGSKSNYCYSFAEPFPAEFCYEIRPDNSCKITINGDPCTSCDIVDVENSELGYTSFNCFAFDCTNTLANLAGNDCLGTYLLDGIFPLGTDSTLPPAFAPDIETLPPTNTPSMLPSINMSQEPSLYSSQAPSVETEVPSISAPTHSTAPSGTFPPSDAPSLLPTGPPSTSPSTSPSTGPTSLPTMLPTETPIEIPTESPSPQPTAAPSPNPTHNPSSQPTAVDSTNPTIAPSNTLSNEPSTSPSSAPIDAFPKSSISPPPALAPTLTSKPTPFPSLSPDFPRRDPSIEIDGGLEASSGSRISFETMQRVTIVAVAVLAVV